MNQQERDIAASIAALEELAGWKHLVAAAEKLIQQNTPNIIDFTPEEATKIASRMAFISGVKRVIGLVQSNKKKLEKPVKLEIE